MAEAAKNTYFYVELDIQLLRELYCAELNPETAKKEEWAILFKYISDYLSKKNEKVTIRQVKDRVRFLLKKFRSDEIDSLRSSGSAEEYDERKQYDKSMSSDDKYDERNRYDKSRHPWWPKHH